MSSLLLMLIALGKSLATSLGGAKGALANQVLDVVALVKGDADDVAAFAGPQITWVNGIIDADRNPTPEEDAYALTLASAVHNNNQSLAAGGPGVPLPSPPAA